MSTAGIEGKLQTFTHGVHPPENKGATEERPIERIPFVQEYVMPLSQHIGAPSVAIVKAGDRVSRGQPIAEPGGFVSVYLHSPVSGVIKAVEPRLHANGKMMLSVVVKADPYSSQKVSPVDRPSPETLSNKQFVEQVQKAGLVGLGGAAFPSHVKLSLPVDKKIEFVVINGCECEPYLTADDRLMVERPNQVVRGTRIMMENIGAKRAYIGIEANKPRAAEALRKVVPPEIEVVVVETKYPQGAEKMLIDAILKREVPSGGLPLDLEILTNNVGTTAALADWFDEGIPLIERVVTVTGPGVRFPRNLLVPLGTPVSTIVEYCGGLKEETKQLIMGGPMMGMPQKSLDVPVMKGTSGIIALTSVFQEKVQEYPCIKCGRCVDACPMFLNPTRLAQLAKFERIDSLMDYHLMDCFECASCSFSCPSNIPLVQWIRIGKAIVREAQSKK